MTHRTSRRRRLGLVAGLAGTIALAAHPGQAGQVALNAPAVVRGGATPLAAASRSKAKLPPLIIQTFSSTSAVAAHPQAQASVPAGYKLIGGGAQVNSTGAGSLLTASFPSGRSWIARSKDHDLPDPATVTAFAVGLFDPRNQWEVSVTQATGAVANAPAASVSVPQGFVMTGGGAQVNDVGGAGNLLVASFPATRRAWEANSTDHIDPDTASITAYAIGLRARNGARGPRMVIVQGTTNFAAHPSGSVSLAAPFQLSGGGAIDNGIDGGNLLTASFPSGPSQWSVAGKDHEVPDPGSLNMYAIGLAP